MRLHPTTLALAGLALLASACGGSSNGTMNVHLVDGPSATYLQVNVDVQKVEIAGDGGWVTLGTPNKVVDLLKLTGGVEEVLANGASLPAGHYGQMRLVLGSRNSVMLADQSTHDLTVPSGMQSGIKLPVSFDVAPGTTKDVFIDFDAFRSIFLHSTGGASKYILRPVVRAVDKLVTGSISGTLTDDAATPATLAGAIVTAQTVDAAGAPTVVRTVKTDDQGHYTLDLLPIGGSFYAVSQPVTATASYGAKASGALAISDAAPTATWSAQFTAASPVGSLGGKITPPVGATEADVVSLMQALDVGGAAPVTLVVDAAAAAFDGTTETYAFTSLPVASPYTVQIIRQGEDASGNPTLTNSTPVPVTVAATGTTLDLTVP